jgi:acetolactate synthase-1/3 small subunit
MDPETSLITIVTIGDDRIVEQIIKQLNKVVEVLKVIDLTEASHLDRETALIKINTNTKPEHRDEAVRICDIFRAKIVDSSPTTYTLEITGDTDKVEALINLLKPLGIKELVRTGRIAIAREAAKVSSSRRDSQQAKA